MTAPDYGRVTWLLSLQMMSLSFGWGLGLFLQRESCDRHFGGWAPETGTPAEHPPASGGVVVPIDSHRAPQSDASTAEQTPSQPVSPQVLLLRPTGSRLWALVVLVVALGIGAWAYTTGMIRTDPEIVAEIEGKFEQDSGLHGKALTAQSLQHVVTIAGTVDTDIQHTAATQQASSVRGVRQLIDQVQLTPPPPPPEAEARGGAAAAAFPNHQRRNLHFQKWRKPGSPGRSKKNGSGPRRHAPEARRPVPPVPKEKERLGTLVPVSCAQGIGSPPRPLASLWRQF